MSEGEEEPRNVSFSANDFEGGVFENGEFYYSECFLASNMRHKFFLSPSTQTFLSLLHFLISVLLLLDMFSLFRLTLPSPTY
jgi:hypothetical protein